MAMASCAPMTASADDSPSLALRWFSHAMSRMTVAKVSLSHSSRRTPSATLNQRLRGVATNPPLSVHPCDQLVPVVSDNLARDLDGRGAGLP